MNGWLNLYKDSGISSFKALAQVRRLLSFKKIGHAGTLDPLAYGILPLAFGQATRTVSYLMASRKTYKVTVSWGKSTTTDDAEGTCLNTSDFRPEKKDIQKSLKLFIGTIDQIPPQFSAIHINGERAYKSARQNINVDIPARKVQIYSIEIINEENFCEPDYTTLLVECGKGTYIRALVRDLGEHLSSPAHVAKLTRLEVGPFNCKNCLTYEELCDKVKLSEIDNLLLPTQSVLNNIVTVNVNSKEAEDLKHGRSIEVNESMHDNPSFLKKGCLVQEVSVLYENRLVAIAQVENGLVFPKRVFK